MILISFLQTLVHSWLEKSQTASRTFESFLNKIDTTTSANPITSNKLKEAFFSLKQIKAQVMTRQTQMLSKIASVN